MTLVNTSFAAFNNFLLENSKNLTPDSVINVFKGKVTMQINRQSVIGENEVSLHFLFPNVYIGSPDFIEDMYNRYIKNDLECALKNY